MDLPVNKTIHFQSVQLYLHISVISETTNHCETHLFPQVLQHSCPTLNNLYKSCCCSSLLWPMQAAAGPTTWKTCKEMINGMYLRLNRYQFIHFSKSGPRNMKHIINGSGKCAFNKCMLFHYHCGTWIAFTQYSQTQTHLTYKLYRSSTLVPQNTLTPVTPTLMPNSINVLLPIIDIIKLSLHPTCSITEHSTQHMG